SVDDPASIRPDIDPAEDAGVTRDAAEAAAVLVEGVIDAYPRRALIVGTPDREPVALHTERIQRGIAAARRRLAEAESRHRNATIHARERAARIVGVEESLVSDEP